LCKEDYVIFLNFTPFQLHVAQQPQGLYIVGLTNHIGFLLKNEEGVFFIHSNYISPAVVTKELIHESKALQSSTTFG
jgi:hypothetical protein